MTCQARSSYTEDEVIWGHRFQEVLFLAEEYYEVTFDNYVQTVEYWYSKIYNTSKLNILSRHYYASYERTPVTRNSQWEST